MSTFTIAFKFAKLGLNKEHVDDSSLLLKFLLEKKKTE